jgi:diguanylate cyclase (GGDEF)-like protein
LDLETLLHQADQDLQNTQEFYNIRLPGLNTLRATLIKATIDLSQVSAGKALSANHPSSSCLTIPHQSLNPAEFIPQTLKAIRDEFSFDRCILLSIAPKRRCLTAPYSYPAPMPQTFEVNINDISGLLITCLREKKAVLITNTTEPNNPIIQQLKADEFFAIPVLHHNRLVSVLYADNSVSKKPLDEHLLPEIIPIACELGIAIVNAKQYNMVKKNAQIDHLTQLSNKRMIDDLLTELFQKGESKLANIAIGFVDIDKFKLFNDTCGHQAGDDALKIVADIMHSLTRPEDFIGRYGGEEFLFVLKNTNEMGAYGYAERIRSEIERRGKIMGGRFNGQQLTVSIGVTLYNRNYTHYSEMIEVADQAMYRAKNEGRNRVVLLPGIEITR